MPRSLTLRPQAQHEALQAARARQQTDDFKARYATRAGIEGTLSQAVRAFDLRRTRYSGHAKTHLQHVLIAVALNLVRLVSWWGGVPRAQTRPSPFAALMQEAASPDQQFATIISAGESHGLIFERQCGEGCPRRRDLLRGVDACFSGYDIGWSVLHR